MGFFDFGKKEKKVVVKKEEEFELSREGIRFRAILEILGSPKKYVEDTLKAFVEKMKVDGYKVLKSKISKPNKLKEDDKKKAGAEGIKEDLFSSYAEVEIAAKDKEKIFDFCFNFMPSSVEVIEPMTVHFNANELSGYLSDVQATLHKIDFSLKQTNAANQLLAQRNENLMHNMIRMLRNNILLALREKSKDMKELAKNVGLTEADLKSFVEKMVKDNEIKFDKNKYSLIK